MRLCLKQIKSHKLQVLEQFNYDSGYQDIQTGQIISQSRVAQIDGAIEKLMDSLGQGRKVYKETLASGGSKAEAQKASKHVAGGRYTTLYDRLCEQNILVSLQVKLPPAKDICGV